MAKQPKSPTPSPLPKPPAVYGETELDYQEYLKIGELLSLQRPLSKPAHHDEMLFIIIHQAYELWFKLLIHELDQVIARLSAKNPAAALHGMKRVVAVVKLLVRQIHLLETMRPIDFLQFRDHLKPASGFQSLQFREIEFAAGIKDPAYLGFFRNRPAQQQQLKRRLEGLDLSTAFFRFLTASAKPRAPSFDPTEPKTWEPAVAALLPLYARPETDPVLYDLAETLIEFDEHLTLWRQHHVNVVERIIGLRIGTGGSSGVAYLRTTTGKRAFPYLWELRTRIGMAGTGYA